MVSVLTKFVYPLEETYKLNQYMMIGKDHKDQILEIMDQQMEFWLKALEMETKPLQAMILLESEMQEKMDLQVDV